MLACSRKNANGKQNIRVCKGHILWSQVVSERGAAASVGVADMLPARNHRLGHSVFTRKFDCPRLPGSIILGVLSCRRSNAKRVRRTSHGIVYPCLVQCYRRHLRSATPPPMIMLESSAQYRVATVSYTASWTVIEPTTPSMITKSVSRRSDAHDSCPPRASSVLTCPPQYRTQNVGKLRNWNDSSTTILQNLTN